MLNNYNFPIQIFLSLEKVKIQAWTSNTNKPNHFFFLINKNWFFLLNNILNKDSFLNKTTLIEASCVDTLKYKKIILDLDFAKKSNRLLTFYSYYNYSLKLRMTFLVFKNNNETNLFSVDSIFKNANWLEREFSEMYGIFFDFKSDTRKLLLDYSLSENPFLKDFNSESSIDNFYNIFEEKVCYIKNNNIEL